MRKTAFLCGVFLISGCLNAGDHGWGSWRKEWLEQLTTEPITFYDNSLRQVKTELLTERNFPENEILTAHVGYSMVDDKTYRKVYYAREIVRPAMDGGFSSNSVPVQFKKSQRLDMIGESFVDGQRYALVPTQENSFVVLIDGEGRPLNKIGQIRNNRLVLLKEDFVLYPDGFYFEPLTLSRSEQTMPIKGFDIKYGGLKGGRVQLIYYNYDAPNNTGDDESGEFITMSFPNKPETVDVNGIGIRIVEATEDFIDYMILPE